MDEWGRIINRFPSGSRYHIPLMIGFYCGLTWDNIDFENRTLTVDHQITIRENVPREPNAPICSWYITDTKTESSHRTIPFGETLYQALKMEKAIQAKNELRR